VGRRTSDDRGVTNGLFEATFSSFLFSSLSCAQYIPVYAKLTDGTGNVSKTAYLHFELQKCGSNFPIVPGNSQVVVQTAFDIRRYAEDWLPACSPRCDQLENHVVRLAHKGCKRFLWSWWYRRLFLSLMPVLEPSLHCCDPPRSLGQ
jgi:hypothetical protein